MLVDFIGNDGHVGAVLENVDQRAEFVVGVDCACGVGWRAEKHHSGAWGDDATELFVSDLEVLSDVGRNGHGYTLGKFYHLNVANPGRGGDNDLVAGVYDG